MKTKLNNKGMSLVELLIAIAIAAVVSTLIVTMMTSGTSMFGKESQNIDLQNELQIVQNQISDRLKEAKAINIVKSGDNIRIYTGDVNKVNNKLVTEGSGEKYTDCIITYKDNKLYVTNSYMEDIPEGYLLSDEVLDFDIDIGTIPTEYTTNETDAGGNVSEITKEYYANPITVHVKIKLGTERKNKEITMKVKIRNEIETFNIYNVTSFDSYLTGIEPLVLEIR